MGTLTNSEDPDEMQHYAAFHHGLHCWLRLRQPSGTEVHHLRVAPYITILVHMHVVLIYMGKPISIQRCNI